MERLTGATRPDQLAQWCGGDVWLIESDPSTCRGALCRVQYLSTLFRRPFRLRHPGFWLHAAQSTFPDRIIATADPPARQRGACAATASGSPLAGMLRRSIC